MSKMEFKTYKLGDLGKVVTGKTPSTLDIENFEGDIPFITPADLTNNSYMIKSSERMISEKGFQSIKSNTISGWSVLIGCIGSDMGNIGVTNMRCATNQQINSITEIKDFCNPIFLFYRLSLMKDYFKRISSSTATPILAKSDFEKVIINLPSIKEQNNISELLSNLDSKIALNRAINKNLEALAKQIYDYWFVQFDFPDENGRPYKSSGGKMVWNEKLNRAIPYEWKSSKVKDVINPIERGISYSSEDISSPDGQPMINLACYSKKGDYRVGEMKYYSGKIKESDKVFPYDLLIACTDMTQGADVIGRPILATEEYDWFVYSMDLAKITPKDISRMYLYYTLRTPFYHKYIKPFASGTTVKHLNVKGVENYKIPVPPKGLQIKFEEIINAIKQQQMLSIKENVELVMQRDELLPLLMNGQVTIE